jgi:glycine cleavage system H lipoate-binding protein
MAAVFVVLTITFFLCLDAGLRWSRRRGEAPVPADPFRIPDAALAMAPGLFLSTGHTWASVQADGDVKVGVDSLVRRAAGKLAGIGLPKLGSRVKRGSVLLSLKLDGRKLDLKSPVSGTVGAVHPAPLGTGAEDWLVIVEPERLAPEFRLLKVAEEATAWLRAEAERFRDFLVEGVRKAAPAMATLPDGGAPAEGVLAILSEEGVASFESEFLAVHE